MKSALYPQLALNGIKKNKKLYLPYILTCTGMVMMHYIVAFLAHGNTLDKLRGGEIMKSCLLLGLGVIGVVSLVFLFYTNSFLIRRRKKELGLYNILGMGKWNIARVLIWESFIISAISIICGLFFGILFSKFAELLMINIMQMQADFSLSISVNSVVYTVGLYAVIFLLILMNTLRQIKTSNPVELLHSENAGEKPPKANWVFAVAGAIIMALAYYIAVSIEGSVEALMWFFIAVVMVIIATYLLFISGSVALCKLLQKKKNYYYKTNHFVSVSTMLFRMKRNGAGLASICILCTMVLVMVSSTVCLYAGAEDSLRTRYQRNIIIDTAVNELSDLKSDGLEKQKQLAIAAAKEKGEEPKNILEYDMVSFLSAINGDKITFSNVADYNNAVCTFIIPLDDYNAIADKKVTLSENEAIIYTTKGLKYKENKMNLEGGVSLAVQGIAEELFKNKGETSNIAPGLYMIVPDFESVVSSVMQITDVKGDNFTTLHSIYGFDLACDDEVQIDIYNAFSDEINNHPIEISGIDNRTTDCSAMERTGFYELYGSLFFLGILLGFVFVFAAVLIIYYKQVSEGYEDQQRFDIMQKVGMNKKEIKKSINSQVLTVFFLPLFVSAVHLGFAFPLIYKMLFLFSITDLSFLIWITIACFAVFALFYIAVYKITSKAYYSIVSGTKD